MSINSINRPQTPLSETQQAPAAAGPGTHNDRVVNQAVGQGADNHSSLSSNIPRGTIRSRRARRPTRSEHSGIFNTLRLCFGRRPQSRGRQQPSRPSAPTSSVNLEANTMALVKGSADIIMEGSQSGIATAQRNIVKGLADEKSSAEVESFLKSGDAGIRRGTTAIYNLGRMLSFANLSDAEKQKLPPESLETLEQQSTQIKAMANTISATTFLDGTKDFFQCGTSENNGYTEMMNMHPEHDQAMRQWIRNGLQLGNELIGAQEQIMLKGREQSEAYVGDLQSRVNIFAGIEKDPAAPLDTHRSAMEGFADEVLSQT